MDSTAIQQIQETALNAAVADHLSNRNDLVVLPANTKLESLERFNPAPFTFRADYNTRLLDDFVSYIHSHDDSHDDAALFINQDTMSAQAILDMGNPNEPGWGRHRATLKLIQTPEYRALLKYNEERLSQQNIIHWLEDWRDYIQFVYEDETDISFDATLQRLRVLKRTVNNEQTQTTSNYNASASLLEAVEVKSNGDKLPTGFKFICRPYEDIEPKTFTCPLRAINDEKSVQLIYRITQLEKHKNDIGEEFKATLTSSMCDGLNIFIGEMKYQNQ